MNKFQRERAAFFSTYRFSEDNKQQIIKQVHKHNKRPKWMWLVVSFAVIFLVVAGLTVNKDFQQQQTASFTEASVLTAFKAVYGLMPEDNMEVLDVKLPYKTKNDALVIVRVIDSDYVRVQHMQFVADEWRFLDASTAVSIREEEYPQYWMYVEDEIVQYFAGVVRDEAVGTVYVGQQRAEFYELEGGARFWIGEALTAGSPVFYDRGSERERVASYPITWGDLTIPYLEAIGNEYTASFSSNTMEKGNGEYTKYPVVIDPYYYATNRYADGDVVVVNVDGEEQLTRIITEQNYNLSIREGTILFNNRMFDTKYTWAHFNGDNTIYTNEQTEYDMIQPDEVFVMPDNWASDGVRGPIKKEQIGGKVLGYSVMDVPEPWTVEEKTLYKKFAAAHDTKELKNVPPQQIVRLQRYAEYIGDYETMYALYSKTSKRKTYKEWLETASLLTTKQAKQQLIHEAILAEEMILNEETNHLEASSKRPFTFKMEQEDDVWKVFYDTVRVIYQ
ncbi:MAG: hypothetical protein ABS951_11685 [Solibacillus sp.]